MAKVIAKAQSRSRVQTGRDLIRPAEERAAESQEAERVETEQMLLRGLEGSALRLGPDVSRVGRSSKLKGLKQNQSLRIRQVVVDVSITREQFDSLTPLFQQLREEMLYSNKVICDITFGYDKVFNLAIGGRLIISGETPYPKLKVDYFRPRNDGDKEVVKGRRGEYEAGAVLNFIYERFTDALKAPAESVAAGQEADVVELQTAKTDEPPKGNTE